MLLQFEYWIIKCELCIFLFALTAIVILWINPRQTGSAPKNDPIFDYFCFYKKKLI